MPKSKELSKGEKSGEDLKKWLEINHSTAQKISDSRQLVANLFYSSSQL